jgi:hypothetical protein
LLGGLLALAARPGAAEAEALATTLRDGPRAWLTFPAGAPDSPIAFRSGRPDDEEASEESVGAEATTALRLLAALLVVPAGTTPTTANAGTSGGTVVNLSGGTGTLGGSRGGGGGGGGGGGTTPELAPEPGGLRMALIGAALVGLAALRRGKRTQGDRGRPRSPPHPRDGSPCTTTPAGTTPAHLGPCAPRVPPLPPSRKAAHVLNPIVLALCLVSTAGLALAATAGLLICLAPRPRVDYQADVELELLGLDGAAPGLHPPK